MIIFILLFWLVSTMPVMAQGVPIWLPNGVQFRQPSIAGFLVQQACPDGSVPTTCDASQWHQLTWADSLPWRKEDWPGPGSGIMQDSIWLTSGGILNAFSTAPFGKF